MKNVMKALVSVSLILVLVGAVVSCAQSQVQKGPKGGEYSTDIVVVGSGVAGLAAAIEAADNGAKVILLEKNEKTGGASSFSGGEAIAAGTDMQKADGIDDRWENLADYWITKGEGRINEAMVRGIASNAPATINWMKTNGVAFMEHLQTPTSQPWANPKRTHKTANGAGTGFTEPLTATAQKKGVTVWTATPATGLITEGGAVTGVTAITSSGQALTIKAKQVILATGGYDSNDELMKQYSPLIVARGYLGDAHNGDGLLWARSLGSPIIAGGGGVVLTINYNLMAPNSDIDPYGIYLYVDINGNRFMNEAEYWFSRSRKVLDLPERAYYAVLDSKALASGIGIEQGVENNTAVKADTLDELAAKMGCDASLLKATVAKYNQAAAAGRDDEFGKAAEKLTAIDRAPFYATRCEFNSNSGSFGGPQINDNCQVLGADGKPIAGLYAAGEVANGSFYYQEYPASGSSNSLSITFGLEAGRNAAAYIRK